MAVFRAWKPKDFNWMVDIEPKKTCKHVVLLPDFPHGMVYLYHYIYLCLCIYIYISMCLKVVVTGVNM